MDITTFYLPGRVCSTAAIREIAAKAQTKYTLICLKPHIEWVYLGQERMVQVMEMTDATMVYADHFANGQQAPVIDYQVGALRDDFDFGSVLLWDTAKLEALVAQMDTDYQFAGLYDLRLRASQESGARNQDSLVHIPEYLYYEIEEDLRKSGEKLFDYVQPVAVKFIMPHQRQFLPGRKKRRFPPLHRHGLFALDRQRFERYALGAPLRNRERHNHDRGNAYPYHHLMPHPVPSANVSS